MVLPVLRSMYRRVQQDLKRGDIRLEKVRCFIIILIIFWTDYWTPTCLQEFCTA